MNYTMDQSQMDRHISSLTALILRLKEKRSFAERIVVLDSLPVVQVYMKGGNPILEYFKGLDQEREYAVKSVIAIGQAAIVFNIEPKNPNNETMFQHLVNQLCEVEKFYHEIGGIIGYHCTVLTMITSQKKQISYHCPEERYIHPEGMQLHEENPEARQAIRCGIENLELMAEIYPVGGAGERLNLIDSRTGTPLPAASLAFLGRTLLEGLIRDLQAREYLFYKLFGKQIETPVAMMTSDEKNNETLIRTICKEHGWFGRSPESFRFFKQPLVPTITKEGNWSLLSHLQLNLKPGGHGVIWKLAEEQGVFNWLEANGRKKSIIRQINNPIGGTDFALLALAGTGCAENKSFGFLSCERLLNCAEGVDVIIEKELHGEVEYKLTNIEYTELAQKGVGEVPSKPGSPYSIYPANTNLLFMDIAAIRKALKKGSIPGQLINMKSKVPYLDVDGKLSQVEGGRLETTMQNIADYLVDRFPRFLTKEEFRDKLQTFIVYNPRTKTISTTKKAYVAGQDPVSTPEQAFYDLQLNSHDLLSNWCLFSLPPLGSILDFVERGPNSIFIYHPALGPCYSIIAQKIRNGRMAEGAELQLEIAEVDISHLEVTGSLMIESKSPLGRNDHKEHLRYGSESRCSLRNVRIVNKGIDKGASQNYWKDEISRLETCRVILHEGAEFHAEDVSLVGDFIFEVSSDHRLEVSQGADGNLKRVLTRIESPTWHWSYEFDAENNIILKKAF